MAKMGENISILIDKTADFMALGQVSREYLNKTPSRNAVPSEVPQEDVQLCLQHLVYYRQLYRPQQSKRQASIALFLKGFF